MLSELVPDHSRVRPGSFKAGKLNIILRVPERIIDFDALDLRVFGQTVFCVHQDQIADQDNMLDAGLLHQHLVKGPSHIGDLADIVLLVHELLLCDTMSILSKHPDCSESIQVKLIDQTKNLRLFSIHTAGDIHDEHSLFCLFLIGNDLADFLDDILGRLSLRFHDHTGLLLLTFCRLTGCCCRLPLAVGIIGPAVAVQLSDEVNPQLVSSFGSFRDFRAGLVLLAVQGTTLNHFTFLVEVSIAIQGSLTGDFGIGVPIGDYPPPASAEAPGRLVILGTFCNHISALVRHSGCRLDFLGIHTHCPHEQQDQSQESEFPSDDFQHGFFTFLSRLSTRQKKIYDHQEQILKGIFPRITFNYITFLHKNQYVNF